MSGKAKEKIVVVGAGLGGISAALSLKAEGFDVEVFEKNAHIGGKLNIREIEGFKFDLGPSILILPHIFGWLFEKYGKRREDYFQITKLEPQWRNFFEDSAVIDLYGDMADMEGELAKLPEPETRGFYEYIDYSRNLWNFAQKAYFGRGADNMDDIKEGFGKVELLRITDYFKTLAEGVDKRIENQHLRDIMAFFVKYVGSSPYNAPAILNLIPYSQLGYGEWYVNGGMFNISKGLSRLMEEQGIPVHLETEVDEIVIDKDAARGIVLKDGREISADIVVSNMEVIPAYKELIGAPDKFMADYEKKFEPSCSGLVVHLGVDVEYPVLAHHNFFFAENLREHMAKVYDRYELPDDPTIYVVCPTRTDKTIAPKGHEIIKLLPHIPHLQDKPFSREQYDALKEKLYIKLERNGVENLREHIVVEDVLYPEDIQRMYYSNRGSIYGVVSDKRKNKGFRAPKRSELYRGLYFVGGSVNPGAGMPMVSYSGQMVRDKILEDYGN